MHSSKPRLSVMDDLVKRPIWKSGHDRMRQNYQFTHETVKRLGLDVELEGHTGCVNCLEWNESGTILASGSDDCHINLWNPFRRRLLSSFSTGHNGNIFSVKFLPQSGDNLILSGAGDNVIRVHDLVQKVTVHVLRHHISRVKRLAVAPNTPAIFWSAAEDGTIMQFDLRDPSVFKTSGSRTILVNLNPHIGTQAEAKCLAINPARPELLAVGANDPFVRLYDRRFLKPFALRTSTVGSSQSDGSGNPFGIPFERLSFFTGEGEPPMPTDCVQYFSPGHLPLASYEYRRRLRSLAATYVTFSEDGRELLVNLGGEQVYLYDIQQSRKPASQLLLDCPAFTGPPVVSGDHLKDHCTKEPNGTNGSVKGRPQNGARSMRPNGTGIEGHFHRHYPRLNSAGERFKNEANSQFQNGNYSASIRLYSSALEQTPDSPVLLTNRAAAYLKRQWDGDVYAALKDCLNALRIDPEYLKVDILQEAHFRMARCLFELSWYQQAHQCLQQFRQRHPEYASNRTFQTLDKEIRAAIYATSDDSNPHLPSEKGRHSPTFAFAESSDTVSSEKGGSSSQEDMQDALDGSRRSSRKRRRSPSRRGSMEISDLEKEWRSKALDYEQRFCGHCNTTTDIKEANFLGSSFICAGSDDGSFFIWDRRTTNIVRVLKGDDSIVNCLQPHPSAPILATSGIDPVVRIWTPLADDEDKRISEREVEDPLVAAAANQRRMNADPLEVMLMNMGYRIAMDEADDSDPDESDPSRRVIQCRPS